MKKLFLLIALFSFHAFAQNAIISGKVLDKDTRESLVGANIILVGTNWGDATDINGLFKIKNIPAGDYTIRVSFVGYDPEIIKDITLNKNDSLFFTISLKVNFALPEVVVQEKKFFEEKSTNTVRIIDSDEIKRLPQKESGKYLRSGTDSEILYSIDGISKDLRYPSDAFNTEEYGLIVENDFLDSYSNPLSTFSIDVDAASYSNIV